MTPSDEARELAEYLDIPPELAERVLAYGKSERRAGYDIALTEVEQGIALPATIAARIESVREDGLVLAWEAVDAMAKGMTWAAPVSWRAGYRSAFNDGVTASKGAIACSLYPPAED